VASSTTNSKAQAALAGNNLIVVLVIVTILVVGVTGLLGKMLVSTIIRDQKVVSAKIKADDQLKENLENAPKLVESYRSLGPLARVLEDALPTTRDFPSVLVTMENIGINSGVKLKAVSPALVASNGGGAEASNTATGTTQTSGTVEPTTSSSATAPTPQNFMFTTTFDGTYPSLLSFMRNLELSARPMRVVNMQLTGTGSALSGSVDVQTFYQTKAELPFSTEVIE
jgi:hypothetical protein